MKKQHINSLYNLLSKYSKQEIIDNIEELNFDIESVKAYEEVFATNETAIAWFKDFCAQYNLTVTTKQVKKRIAWPDLLIVQEFGMSGYNRETDTYEPYFMLWTNDIGPHVEMGSSYIDDLWSGMWRLTILETKMHKICELRGIKKVDK